MDLIKAAQLTRQALGELTMSNPARRGSSGRGLHHAIWMLDQIETEEVSGEKGHRWLGYAQGILVQLGVIDLDQAKEANVRA